MKIPEKIDTRRLILRPIKHKDFQDFFNFIHHIDSNKFLNFIPECKTYEAIEALINSVIESYKTAHPILIFSIIEKKSDLFLGFSGLIPHHNELKCIYGLLPQYWDNGYMIETLKKLFEYGFSIWNLTRIVAYVPNRNTRAWKVAERAGMKYLGDIQYKKTKRAMYFTIDRTEFYKQTLY
ncbi:MAG: GNAT family N-acetyltransferase [Candidatus Hodarchaeota archaeon]